MIFGFNTDLRVGDTVFHIQTEDRGMGNPIIDTTVYCKGRIVHRRVADYKDLIPSLEFAPQRLRERLEEQHRSILEELRSGALKFEDALILPKHAAAPGIQVQLVNPASWLAAGTATLRLAVRSKPSGEPVGNVHVEVKISGGQEPKSFSGKTDHAGCAELSFPLTHTGGGMELLIRATHASAFDELRYSLRPKPKT